MTLRGVYALWILAGLTLVACTERSSESSQADLTGGDDLSDRAEGGEPDATDPALVRPYISELLVAHDGVVNQIVADPAIASDPDNPVVAEYRDLYEPRSDAVAAAMAVWADNAEAALSVQPFSATYPTNTTRLDGDIEVLGPDEVRFPTCEERRQNVYSEGALVEQSPYAPQLGEGIAVRVDGRWRLRRLDVFSGTGACRIEESS